jgi:hypothetical protein
MLDLSRQMSSLLSGIFRRDLKLTSAANLDAKMHRKPSARIDTTSVEC